MSELVRHRQVLIAAAAGVGLSIAGIPTFVLSVFAGPMTRDLGWTLQQFQTGGLFIALGVLVAAPLGGWLLDRYGPRRVAMTGLLAFAAGIAGVSRVGAEPWTFYLAILMLTLLAAGVLPTTWTRIVNGRFDRQRGIALGIALSGSGIFATFGPGLAQAVIDAAGWRMAWLALAALPACVALPLVWRFVRPAPAIDGATSSAVTGASAIAGVSSPAKELVGLTLTEVLRARRFWMLIASFALVSLCLGGFNANLVPILISKGLETAVAAKAAGALGASLIAGRIVSGFLIDRYWSPGVAAAAFSLPVLGALLLMGDAPSAAMLVTCVALMGFAAGAEYDVLAFMISRFFGLAHYGKIYSVIIVAISLATSGGAVLFGRIRDLSGDFAPAWPLVVALCAVSVLLLLTLGRDRSAGYDA